MNLAEIQAVYAKLQSAINRLNTLIKNGAVEKDIDDQKAVVSEVMTQFKEVAGIDSMPTPPVA